MGTISNISGSISTPKLNTGTISNPYGGGITTQFNPIDLFINSGSGFYGDTSVFSNNFTTAAGSTNADEAGDPLGRIVRLAGSLNLTQGTDANRPALGTAEQFYLPVFDGTNDFLTTGVQSFGNASLFADAGQAWTVWVVFRTLSTGTMSFVAKRGAGASLRMFEFGMQSILTVQIRNSTANPTYAGATNLADDAVHVALLRWDGEELWLYVDSDAPVEITGLGTAAEEAENITIGCRTESSPANAVSGHLIGAMIDRALTAAETTQTMNFLNSYYRTPP